MTFDNSCNLFKRSISGSLSDTINSHFNLSCSVYDSIIVLAVAMPRSLWQCVEIIALSILGRSPLDILSSDRILQAAVAGCIGDVNNSCSCFYYSLDNFARYPFHFYLRLQHRINIINIFLDINCILPGSLAFCLEWF